MKNKALTYGLLIVVAIVWYQVFVRIKSNIAPEEEQPSRAAMSGMFNKTIKKRKTILVQANYRDPFIQSIPTGESLDPSLSPNGSENNGRPTVETPPKPIPEKKIVYWPAIKYHGFVRNVDSKTPRVVVEIDRTIFKMQVQEYVLDDIQLLKADKESITLRYQKEKKTFWK